MTYPATVSDREQQADLAWVSEHMDAFWSAAQLGYQQSGRGVLIIDTTTQFVQTHGGHEPMLQFGYMLKAKVESLGDETLTRRVRLYDPAVEFVAVLVRPDRQVSYTITVEGVNG